MTHEEHVEAAERLLETAKEVSKREKKTGEDRKNDETIVYELLAFSRAHADIACALRF